jgi:hypothetical protein
MRVAAAERQNVRGLMFAWLRQRLKAKPTARGVARGILATYVSDNELTLSKSSPTIRNSYEIRLALFFAVNDQKRFILSVRPDAVVEPTVRSLVEQYGGVVREEIRQHFSVYVGHRKNGGDEGDGWVVGDEAKWERVRAEASPAIREVLEVGRVIGPEELESVEEAAVLWRTGEMNVDEEPINQAFVTLLRQARREGGEIFIQ